jgi:DNA-binding response OmpR family regulator
MTRILVVDDEKDITLVFKSGLERRGFEVDAFNDPAEALLNFRPGHYDLLLLDIRMPALSGFELFREILKKDGRARACFISAFEFSQEELQMLAAEGSPCYVRKPVSMKELVVKIGEQLAGG